MFSIDVLYMILWYCLARNIARGATSKHKKQTQTYPLGVKISVFLSLCLNQGRGLNSSIWGKKTDNFARVFYSILHFVLVLVIKHEDALYKGLLDALAAFLKIHSSAFVSASCWPRQHFGIEQTVSFHKLYSSTFVIRLFSYASTRRLQGSIIWQLFHV